MNSEPLPKSLLTEMFPPIALTMRREMASPRPAPPWVRVDVPSRLLELLEDAVHVLLAQAGSGVGDGKPDHAGSSGFTRP